MPQYIDLLDRLIESQEPESHDGDAYFDPEALKMAAAQNDQSREKLIHMDPRDFIKVAMSGFDMGKYLGVQDAIIQGNKFSTIPFLGFVHDGDGTAVVTGHEGRHRAHVLAELGVKSMPVLFKHVYDGNGTTIRWGSVAQEWKRTYDDWPNVLYGERGDSDETRLNAKNSIPFPVSDPRKNPLTEAQFRRPEIMFHGTSSLLLRKIMKEGVIPFPKKRVWDQDRDVSSVQQSRASIGGSYWTDNILTATGSARTAKENLGGGNRLIVIAEIQQQSAFSDEDSINGPLSYGLDAVSRYFGLSDIVYAGFYFLTDQSTVKRDEAVQKFQEAFQKRVETPYVIPTEQALAIIRAAILRKMAHEFKDEHWRSRSLYRMNLPEDFPIPSIAQAEADFLKVKEALTRTFRYQTYKDESPGFNTLRLETTVGFSGANKIVGIVELIEYDYANRSQDRFILHYGRIPEDFRKEWRSMVGSMRPVYSPQGKLLEPTDKQELTEGLIKVPESMIAKCKNFLTRQVLWWARDQIKDAGQRYPDHVKAFEELRAQHPDVTIPDTVLPTKKLLGITIDVTTDGLPANYQRLTPSMSAFRFAVDFDPNAWNGAIGFWWAKKAAVIVDPMNIAYLKNWTREHAENLKLGLEELHEVVSHELRHVIQTVLFGDVDPRQVERLNKYSGEDGGNTEYYLSQVEFDTTIGSVAHAFIQQYRTVLGNKRAVSLSRAIKQFVGAERGMIGGFQADKFFRVLKKNDPPRWRVAVKKFIGEVQRLLAEQL